MTTLYIIYNAIGLIVLGLALGKRQLHEAVFMGLFWPIMLLAILRGDR